MTDIEPGSSAQAEDYRLSRPHFVGGVILILLGVAFLLDEFRVADFGDLIARYWPLFVIIAGVARLFQPGRLASGIWVIAIGAWLFISNLGLFGLHWGSSWPLLLVLIGVSMIFEGFFPGARKRRRYRHQEHEIVQHREE